MRTRCLNKNAANYKYYGGRGIGFDPAWDVFSRFYADMAPRPEGLSLDRIDVNADYSKENCRWATQKQQMANRRVSRNAIGAPA